MFWLRAPHFGFYTLTDLPANAPKVSPTILTVHWSLFVSKWARGPLPWQRRPWLNAPHQQYGNIIKTKSFGDVVPRHAAKPWVSLSCEQHSCMTSPLPSTRHSTHLREWCTFSYYITNQLGCSDSHSVFSWYKAKERERNHPCGY